LLQLKRRLRRHNQFIVSQFKAGVGAFKIKARGNLFVGLVNGVFNFVFVEFGNDVERLDHLPFGSIPSN